MVYTKTVQSKTPNMNLFIEANPGDRLEEFIETIVIPEIQFQILKRLDDKMLLKWDEYFKNENIWKDKISYNAIDIIAYGANNLSYQKNGDNYIIEINPNVLLPKTFFKIDDLCRSINYGNLEIPPCPIFKDAFNDVSKRLVILFKNYIYYL